jgi:hypothetical protein
MPIEAIHCMKWLSSLKGATGKVNEHMSLYFNMLGPKGENRFTASMLPLELKIHQDRIQLKHGLKKPV